LKALSFPEILENIKKEVAHKQVTKAELACLVNADIFLLISGQRSYFFEQKIYYLKEISRLEKLYNKFRIKKHDYKNRWLDKCLEFNDMVNKMKIQIAELNAIVK